MSFCRIYTILCLIQLFAVRSYAQDIRSITHYTTLDGLSDNRLTAITKDKEGFVWFGSWAGINRFDGKNFVSYKSNPGDYSSLKSNRIDGIVEDKSSYYLWVKAYDNQIYRFDKRTHTFTSLYQLINNNFFKETLFSKILGIVNDQVWLKTEDEEVVVIQDAAGKHPAYHHFKLWGENKQRGNKLDFFHLDSRGYAWIAFGSALNVIRRDSACNYRVKHIQNNKSNPFKLIEEDQDGNIWLSHAKGYAEQFNKKFKHVRTVHLSAGQLHDMERSEDGEKMFFSTSSGQLFAVYKDGRKESLGSLADKSPLYSIFEDSAGNLWVESERFGAVRWSSEFRKLQTLFPPRKYGFKPWVKNYTVFEDINKRVWIGIKGDNLFFYDDDQHQMKGFAPTSGGIHQSFAKIIQDVHYNRSGELWVSTDHGGLDRIILQEKLFTQFYPFPENKIRIENEVRGLYADEDNRIWMGTKSGKVITYKGGKADYRVFKKDFNPGGGVYNIVQDRQGTMWLATKGGGIFQAEERNGRFEILANLLASQEDKARLRSDVYSLAEDSRGRMWVGTYGGGLVSIEQGRDDVVVKTVEDAYKSYPKGNYQRIRKICLDKKERLWIATTEGLVIFDPNDTHKKKFKIYRKEPGNIHSLGGNDIQYIYKDSKDRMWILSSSGGLNLAVGDDPMQVLSFINFSVKDGLPSDFLLSCAEDQHHNLWIASQNGISRFSLNNFKIQNYNYYDGLHEAIFSESSCIRLRDGNIAFGNSLGFLTFEPEALKKRRSSANLIFTRFQVNSKDLESSEGNFDVNYSDQITLKHNENVIGIEFALLSANYLNPEHFEYRLLGFDEVWRNTEGQQKVIYNQLPPGDYTFQVKSLNEDYFTNKPFRTLEISILPPFYKTWWAYLVYCLLLVAVFYLIQRVAVTIFRLRQGIAVEKRLAEVKLNFFTQISHELRTPLTLILNPIEEIVNHEKLSFKGKGYATVVKKNAMRMIRLVNQVLDLRKVQSGKETLRYEKIKLKHFIQEIILLFEDQLQRKEILVRLESVEDEIILMADADKIEIVFYNLLANAIKFSPQKSKILIQLSLEGEEQCTIAVSDEGPGVDEGELKQIFQLYYEGKSADHAHSKGTGIGLALAQELVLLHEGKIHAKNQSPHGLKVVVELPKASAGYEKPASEPEFNYLKADDELVPEELQQELSQLPEEKIRILIVEDNEDLRTFLSDKLNDFYHIELASDGEEGFRKALAIMPDLILSDIMMPKTDGIQLLNKLKNNSVVSHIPIILLTARHTIETHIQSLKYGADYYLPKPLNVTLLITAINNILMQRKKFLEQVISGDAEVNPATSIKENPVLTEFDRQFLDRTLNAVKENMDNPDFNIDTVAELLDMSRSGFYKKFKSLTNVAPVDFVKDVRLEKAKSLFDEGHQNVSEVAYSTGFNNPKYFGTCFKARFASTPKAYIQRKKQSIAL